MPVTIAPVTPAQVATVPVAAPTQATPLDRFAARAAAERVRWPVLADDFVPVRRSHRGRRPAVTTYVHQRTGGQLHLDDRGRPYRPVPTATGQRLIEWAVRPAVFAARLHHAAGAEVVEVDDVAFEVVATRGHLRLLRPADSDDLARR